jgi:valyl-tRNA synthetase
MDTWATSSLSPLIVCGWERDPDLFAAHFPMDMRPQAHEIIRTWLFSTVVRVPLRGGRLPGGRRRSRDRRRPKRRRCRSPRATSSTRSTSGALRPDAVRWRAAGARPGTDSPFDEAQMKIGRRLAIKDPQRQQVRTHLGVSEDPGAVTEPLDKALLATLAGVVRHATAELDAYNYTAALEATETFFWTFCDDYLELVKDRGLRRPGRGRGRVRPSHADDGAVGPAAAVRAVPARS